MMSEQALSNIQAGDYVWVGNHGYDRSRGIKKVSRVTPTLIILGAGDEFDRYKRKNGVQHANLMWKDYISAVATTAQVAQWDAEQAAKAAAVDRKKAEEEAFESRPEVKAARQIQYVDLKSLIKYMTLDEMNTVLARFDADSAREE